MEFDINKVEIGRNATEADLSKVKIGGKSKKRKALEQQIGLATLESDLKSTAELVNNTYGGWQDANTMAATKNKVAEMQRRLKAYEQFRNTYAPDSPQNNELLSGYNDILSGWDERANEYAKYKNKEDYDKAVKDYEAYQGSLVADIGELDSEIESLKPVVTEAERLASMVQSAQNGSQYSPNYYNNIKSAQANLNKYLTENGYSSLEELKAALNNKQIYRNNAKNNQALEEIKKPIVSAEDFESKSQFVKPQGDKNDLVFNNETGAHEYKDKLENVYVYINAKGSERKGNDTNTTALPIYDEQGRIIFGQNNFYSNLKEDEIKTFNYLYNSGKTQEAKEYLGKLRNTLETRDAFKFFEENLKGKPVLEVLYGFGAGVDQWAQGLTNVFNTEDDYIEPSYAQKVGGYITEDMGDVGDSFYNTATIIGNMAPSILVSYLTGGVASSLGAGTKAVGIASKVAGAGTMGLSAAGNAYAQAINMGWEKPNARTYSSLVGISEAGLSYVFSGISKLGGAATSKSLTAIASGIDNGLLRFAAKYGLKASSEAFEEMAQEVLNPLFENIALGYNKNGFSDIDWSEVVYAGLMALVTTGFFEGVPTVLETKAEGQKNKTAKHNFPDAESQGYLISEGMELGGKAKQLAEQLKAKLDKGKTLKGSQISRQIDANQEAIKGEDITKIKTAAQNRLKELGETANVSTVADIVTKQAVGENLTNEERKTLADSKYGARVANEANPRNIASGDYSSYWAEIIETDIVNAEQYNKSIDGSTNTQNLNMLERGVRDSANKGNLNLPMYEEMTTAHKLNRVEQRILNTADNDLSLGEKMFKQRLLTTIGNKKAFARAIRNTPTAMDMLTPTVENGQTPETAVPMETPSKITVDMSETDRAKILKEKSIVAVPVVEGIPLEKIKKLENVTSWEDINKLFGNKKRQLIQKIAEEFGVFKEYINSDINVSFEFSKNNFRESYHKQKINYEQFAKMFSVFDKVIENAVGIEAHNRNKAGYKFDSTLNNVYVLISAFEDGNLIVPVKLEVKDFNDKQNTLYVAISLEAIKKAEVSKQGTTENGVAQNSRSATISIPDLFAKINPKDKNFLKYIPDEFLNNEQIKAKKEALEAEAKKYGRVTDNDLGFELSAANPKFDAIQDQVEKATGIKHLSEDQKQLRKIGQQFGAKVEFRNLDEIRVVNGQKVLFSPEGEFDPDTNTITLNTNVKDYHNPVQYILKHELTHSLEVDPESYNLLASDILSSKAFKDYVKTKKNGLTGQSFNSSTEWAQDIIDRYKRKGVEIKGDPQQYARNEMVANFVGDMLFGGKTKITENLLNAMQPQVKKTFIEKVKAFFKKLGSIFKGKQLTEIQKLENRFIETAQKVAEFNEKGNKKTTTEGSGKAYSFEGYAEDGKGKYKSNFEIGTPKAAKAQRILKYIQEVWSKKPIRLKLEENGQTRYIEAQFDPTYDENENILTDASKLMGGNRHGTASDQRVTLDLADDYYQIASESTYNYSKDETGKDNPAHKGVTKWHYFINNIYFSEYNSQEYIPYRVTINVKEKADGQYVYSFSAEKQRESNTPQTLHAVVNEGETPNANVQLSNNRVTQNDPTVNTYSTQESENYSEENKKDKPYSLSEAEVDDVLLALQNGEISTEQAKERLSRDRVKTPYEIATTPKEKASWTPELSKPKGEGEGDGESSFFSSVIGSKIITPEMKAEIENNTYIKNYQTQSNKKTLKLAVKELEEGGSDRVNDFYKKWPEHASAVDVGIGMILLEGYQREGNTAGAMTVAEKLREIATASGQTVQMFSIIGRYTPEMMVAYAQKELTQAFNIMAEKQTKRWVKKHKEKLQLTNEDIEYITNHTLMAANLPDGSRTKAILLAEICTLVQNKLPSTAGQKLRSLQRVSLLLNLKTNVRNILGNASMVPMFIASDFFGNLIDKGLAKKTGVRTTGNFQFKGSGTAFMKGIYESYDDFKRGIRTKQEELNRYEVNQGGGKSFNENHELELLNTISKTLNKLDSFTSFCLEAGDRSFFEMWFNNSLNNLKRLNKVELPTKEMLDIATQEALQRTWQNNTALTRTMSCVKKAFNYARIPGTDYGFGDFTLKFVKTPANLGKAMVEFSPLGVIQAVANGVKYKNALEKGELTAAMQKELVRSTSNAITGTLVYVLVAIGAAVGIVQLSGRDDEDKDVSNFEKYIVGVPPYSMKIFGVDVSYSWNQPLGTVFATVADIMDNSKDGIDSTWGEDLWRTLKTAGTVFTEQSFLMSLYELFSAEDLVTGLAESVLSEPAAFIPQFFAQIASFTDPNQRITYDATSSWQSALNGVLLKIPGLRQLLPERVNVLGEKVENVQFLNPWEAFLNPSNTYPESSGAVAEEIYALYKETSNKTVMPRVAPYYFSVKGEKIVFNAEERAEFQKEIGTTSVNILDKMFSSDAYKKLSDEEKVKAISKVYEYSTAKFKSEYAYDYETLSAMEGEDKQGNPLLSKARYEKIGKDGRRILAQEYFLSKEERTCKGDYEKLAQLFIRKADKN